MIKHNFDQLKFDQVIVSRINDKMKGGSIMNKTHFLSYLLLSKKSCSQENWGLLVIVFYEKFFMEVKN